MYLHIKEEKTFSVESFEDPNIEPVSLNLPPPPPQPCSVSPCSYHPTHTPLSPDGQLPDGDGGGVGILRLHGQEGDKGGEYPVTVQQLHRDERKMIC